jgi:hypothetical protein
MPNIKLQDESRKDTRLRETREQSGNKEQEHLTKEGEPDRRYKENKDDREDQQQRSDDKEEEHLTKEGEPDRRYKENKDDQDKESDKRDDDEDKQSDKRDDDDSSALTDIPTKKDGTADMRYADSKEAVSSGLISKDEVIEDDDRDDNEDKKADGSDDKRSKEKSRLFPDY